MAFKGAIKYAWKERGEGSQAVRRKSTSTQPAPRLLRRGNFSEPKKKNKQMQGIPKFYTDKYVIYVSRDCTIHF